MPSQLWLKFDKIVRYLQILNESARILSRRGLGMREFYFGTSLLAVCEVSLTGIGRNNLSIVLKDLVSALRKSHKFCTT